MAEVFWRTCMPTKTSEAIIATAPVISAICDQSVRLSLFIFPVILRNESLSAFHHSRRWEAGFGETRLSCFAVIKRSNQFAGYVDTCHEDAI
jgi:hypothetical protein